MECPNTSLYVPQSLEDIPEDILKLILEKFSCFDDLFRFAGTCTYFRSLTRERQLYQRPWLMLPNRPSDKTRDFYSPLENKVYNLRLPKFVRRSACNGSSQGWLIFAHKSRGNFIYNPITKKRIRLPTPQVINFYDNHHIKRYPYFLLKVVLSTVPLANRDTGAVNPPPLMAAAIAGNFKILVTCFTDNKWHHFCPIHLQEITGPLCPSEGKGVRPDYRDEEEEVELKFKHNEDFMSDIIFHKGEFYAVNNNADLIIIRKSGASDQDFSIRKVCMMPLKFKRKEHDLFNGTYLVESDSGELLMVLRFRKRFTRYDNEVDAQVSRMETSRFLVFRLELNASRWIEVESLGDQVLTLGHNYSKSISSHALGLPPGDTRRRNCIYFTDDGMVHYWNYDVRVARSHTDTGLYHLADGSIEKLLPTELCGRDHLYCLRFRPIMFTPNPFKTLRAFREGEIQVLVSSDAMMHGMDVEGVRNVINYNVPPYIKTYIHWAGRTARAGLAGRCFTLLWRHEVKWFKKLLQRADCNTW